jgi:hypothetical protein
LRLALKAVMQNDEDFVDVICYSLEDVNIKPHHGNDHTEHKSSAGEAYSRWKTVRSAFWPPKALSESTL